MSCDRWRSYRWAMTAHPVAAKELPRKGRNSPCGSQGRKFTWLAFKEVLTLKLKTLFLFLSVLFSLSQYGQQSDARLHRIEQDEVPPGPYSGLI